MMTIQVNHDSPELSRLYSLKTKIIINLDETCSKCLPLLNLGQVRNWVTWGQKLGHRARSAENLVNTLAVTFLKQSS